MGSTFHREHDTGGSTEDSIALREPLNPAKRTKACLQWTRIKDYSREGDSLLHVAETGDLECDVRLMSFSSFHMEKVTPPSSHLLFSHAMAQACLGWRENVDVVYRGRA